MTRTILLFATIIMSVVLICSIVFAHEKGYIYTAPQTLVPPNIDGKLNDVIWQYAPSVKCDNINTGGKVKKEYLSEAWAIYDDKFIYVAFTNGEPNPKKLTTVIKAHDGGTWKDDENELFIEPNHNGTKPYFHIMINAANVTEDAENGGAENGWEPKSLKSATQIRDKDWILELRISFEDLGIKGGAPVGETWGWNFNRHIMSGVDIWTGWSTTGPSFHTPDRFGDLIFGKEKMSISTRGKVATTWGNVKYSKYLQK